MILYQKGSKSAENHHCEGVFHTRGVLKNLYSIFSVNAVNIYRVCVPAVKNETIKGVLLHFGVIGS